MENNPVICCPVEGCLEWEESDSWLVSETPRRDRPISSKSCAFPLLQTYGFWMLLWEINLQRRFGNAAEIWIQALPNMCQKSDASKSICMTSIQTVFSLNLSWIPNFFHGSISQSQKIIFPSGSSYLLSKFYLRQKMAKLISCTIIHCM